MHRPKTGATYYHTQFGPPEKSRALKRLVVWRAFGHIILYIVLFRDLGLFYIDVLVSLKDNHLVSYLFVWFNLLPGVYILWTSLVNNIQVNSRDLKG